MWRPVLGFFSMWHPMFCDEKVRHVFFCFQILGFSLSRHTRIFGVWNHEAILYLHISRYRSYIWIAEKNHSCSSATLYLYQSICRPICVALKMATRPVFEGTSLLCGHMFLKSTLLSADFLLITIHNQGRTNQRNAGKTSVDRSTKTTLTLTIPGCN